LREFLGAAPPRYARPKTVPRTVFERTVRVLTHLIRKKQNPAEAGFCFLRSRRLWITNPKKSEEVQRSFKIKHLRESRGDSDDNALAETINGLYKTELIHRRAPWKTWEAVERPPWNGWKSRTMVDRYAKFATENLLSAASRIERRGSGRNVISLSRFSHGQQ